MNRDFTHYQKLPSVDALLVSTNPLESGIEAKPGTTVTDRRLLFPLPEGEGQGEGKRAVPSGPRQSIKSLRA